MGGLFSFQELVEATGGKLSEAAAGLPDAMVGSVSIDSRTLQGNALFVAIRGDNFDGHDFVANALERGAALAMVEEGRAGAFAGMPVLEVPDPLAGLERLGRWARTRSRARIVAVTGSAGKTTTKSMVAEVLAGAGATHASIRSYNNHWGVPLMLANLPPSADFGVFEIGMNHSGEIAALVEQVHPHVALVTHVGVAHVGNFEDAEGVARAKAEIISGLEPDGLVLVNGDHGFMHVFDEEAGKRPDVRMQTFGFSPDCNVRISDYHSDGRRAQARAHFGRVLVDFSVGMPGRHMISNGAGALCVSHQLGVCMPDAVAALGSFEAEEGRGSVQRFGEGERELVLLDESYNANPASMEAALEVFARIAKAGGRRVLVLGDMLELGEQSASLHKGLLPALRDVGPDLVFLVGRRMCALAPHLGALARVETSLNADGILPRVLKELDWGDQIMVKGSNGVGLSRIVSGIRGRFAGAQKP